jgi:SAM-dependent methyltransferase
MMVLGRIGELPPEPRPVVFALEQVTSLFQYLSDNAEQVQFIGSEWLGPDVAPGAIINGIRHEDCAHLSLADESVDVIFSMDVFEHVPDPRQGFREKARVLRPGGRLFMTVPFFPQMDTTVQRAAIEEGHLEHLLPPMYHSNPVDPAAGSLVFFDYGWDLLAMMKDAGFADVWFDICWSADFGHLGTDEPQIVFCAVKR